MPSAATPTPEAGRAAALTGRPGSGLMHVESTPELQDTWVTVFGFGSDDLPLVLGEFQKCGDILQWGSFGASPSCNFIHIQVCWGGRESMQPSEQHRAQQSDGVSVPPNTHDMACRHPMVPIVRYRDVRAPTIAPFQMPTAGFLCLLMHAVPKQVWRAASTAKGW